jgi:hypothetical protein
MTATNDRVFSVLQCCQLVFPKKSVFVTITVMLIPVCFIFSAFEFHIEHVERNRNLNCSDSRSMEKVWALTVAGDKNCQILPFNDSVSVCVTVLSIGIEASTFVD